MKFCARVPRTCLHKRLVLDFSFICLNRALFQTVHKLQPINIRYLTNLQFFKENGSYQTCSSIQGTQITVESGFISRFTMTNIAPKLQKCWTHNIFFTIISKMLKQPNFFCSQPSALSKEAPAKFYLPTTFGLSFMIRSVAPTRSSTFYAPKSETVRNLNPI